MTSVLDPLSLIMGIVGIISCIIGIATFTSSQLTKAKQDGMIIAKIDQCVKGIDELKCDIKEKNGVIDEHSQAIIELQTKVHSLEKEVYK